MCNTVEEDFCDLIELKRKFKKRGATKSGDKEMYFAGSAHMFAKILALMKQSKSEKEFNAVVEVIGEELNDFFQKKREGDNNVIKTIDNICPHCQSILNTVQSEPGETYLPTPGDTTLCAYCNNISIFKDDMTIRALTDDDEIDQDMLDGLQDIIKTRKNNRV